MSKSINDLENEVAILQAAVHSAGPHAGKRVYETDAKYRAAVFAKQVEITQLKEAERKQVHINPEQARQLNSRWTREEWHNNVNVKALQGALGAKNPASGRRWVEEKPALRAEIERGLANTFDGQRTAMSAELTAIVRGDKK